MAVHIRLRRIGKNPKGKPHFRVSVFDERKGRDGRVLKIGFTVAQRSNKYKEGKVD